MEASKILGRIRRGLALFYGDGQGEIALSPGGGVYNRCEFPGVAELIRQGDSWTARIATASAFTYVNALPTTRAEMVLYNGEATNGKSYVIDSAFLFGISSTGVIQPVTLLAQLVPAAVMVAPTHNATTTILDSLSAKSTYAGNAKRAVAVTTMFTDKWTVIGSANSFGATTTLGHGIAVDLNGRYIVPPGAGFGLAAVAGTAAGTAIIGVTWHEVQISVM